MKVICVDDKNRPNEIPANFWIKEGEVYTVILSCKLNAQGGKIGFKISEINLDRFSPYEYFDSSRFHPFLGPAESVALEYERLVA
jgi:hypothetical protein